MAQYAVERRSPWFSEAEDGVERGSSPSSGVENRIEP
jgi:hypothetical protein